MRSTRSRAVGGFSLLELLVALVIMSMSLGMLYQASTGALRGVGELDQTQRAQLLAQSILDARDTVPKTGWVESGVDAGMQWRVDSSPYPTTASNANLTLPPLHEVKIVVEWPGRVGSRRLELQTLLPQARDKPISGAGAAVGTR